MPGFDTNFEPIYVALTTLLQASCQIPFTATATLGSPVLTGLADTSVFSAGLALLGDAAPQGDFVRSIDSPTQITMELPSLLSGVVNLKAGMVDMTIPAMRNLQHWGDVLQSAQPAVFVTGTGETQLNKRIGQPGQWIIDTLVWVYVMSPDTNTPSAPALSSMLTLTRNAMSRDKSGPGSVQNRQTLGGLVLDTWIEGKITTDNGFLGQQAVAKVPIRMIQNGPI